MPPPPGFSTNRRIVAAPDRKSLVRRLPLGSVLNVAILAWRRLDVRAGLAIGVAFALSTLTMDYTRVFMLLAFPLILVVTESLVDERRISALPVSVSWLPFLALVQMQIHLT